MVCCYVLINKIVNRKHEYTLNLIKINYLLKNNKYKNNIPLNNDSD